MKLDGTANFPFDATNVWTALHDVDVLTKTIPGCTSMKPDGDGAYRVTLSLGVAAIKGDYEGTIKVTDVEFPARYTLYGEGEGKPGFVKVNVECSLESTDVGSLLHWSSDAEVGGLIAGIGGRVITGISKHMAKQFFKALNDEMALRFDPKSATSAEG